MKIIDRIGNLVPHLSRAAELADDDGRDGDAAIFRAASNLFSSLAVAIDVPPAPAAPSPPAPPAHVHAYDGAGRCACGCFREMGGTSAPAAKHRHAYDAGGVCACGRKHRPRTQQTQIPGTNGSDAGELGAIPAAPVLP